MTEFFETPLGLHLLFVVIALPPLVMIYRRAGLAPWGAFLVVIPVVGFALGLGALVGQRWPAASSGRSQDKGLR